MFSDFRSSDLGDAWLAQVVVEHVILDLRVVSLNCTLGVEITYKKKISFFFLRFYLLESE